MLSVGIFRKVQNAVKNKDVIRISQVVTQENVNMTDSLGYTFLHFVAKQGTPEMAKLLLKLGSNVNQSADESRSPIFFAIRNSIEMVQTLLDNKAVTDSRILHRALYFGSEELVRLLVRNKKDVSESSKSWSRSESRNQKPGVLDECQDTEGLMKVLLNDVQFPMKKKKHYPLLIFFTAKMGKKDLLQLVLNDCRKCLPTTKKETEEGPEYREELSVRGGTKNETALHYAVSEQRVDVVRFLLEQGADPNCTSKAKLTPLHYAVCLKNREICEILLRFGASVKPTEDGVCDPLYLVCGCSMSRPHANFSEFIVDKLLHFKSGFDNDIIKLLLQHGSNPDGQGRARNGTLMPFLLHACKANRFEEVKTLLEFGAKLEVVDAKGNTALHHAVDDSDAIQIVKLLLDKGININAENNNKHTPLVFIMLNKVDYKEPSLQMIEYLMDRGANLHARNSINRNVFDFIMFYERPKLVLLLIELDADGIVKRNSDFENQYSMGDLRYSVSEVARQILISYIALKVDNINKISTCYLNSNNMKDTLLKFHKSKLEIENLKAQKVLCSISGTPLTIVEGFYSYYDFLTRDLVTVMRIFQNPFTRQRLMRGESFWKFPYFKSFLEHRVMLVTDLENCYDTVVHFFLNYGKIRLNIVVVEMILSYFSWRDFKLLKKALSDAEY